MKKQLAFFVAVLLLVLMALGSGRPAVQALQGTKSVTLAATMVGTQSVVLLKNGLRLESNTSQEQSDKPKLNITVMKPVLSGATTPAVANFNQAVDDMLQKTVKGFKDEMAQTESAATLPPELSEMGSYVDIWYDVFDAGDNLISVKFNVGSFRLCYDNVEEGR